MGGVREIENSNERFKYFKVQSIYISSKGHFKYFYARIMIQHFFSYYIRKKKYDYY